MKFDDYIVLAIDGSKIELLNNKNTRKKFNLSEKGIVNRKSARATFSAVTDVYNEFVLDSVMCDGETSEEELIMMNLDNLEDILELNKVIILLNREYPSIKLFSHMISKGIKFICRLPSNYYQHENEMDEN
ncbi:MAG: transposase [Methanobrevibacter sp.]|nr:transposase [Candidatus Methanovirga basalitermitum]